MKISFLITCYNLEEWLLRRCVESLYQQQLAENDFEVILVDDGSANFPESIIDDYAKGNLKYIRQENLGPGGARNTCLDAAKGEYCFFVDGDDYLFRNSLQPVMRFLKEHAPDIISIGFSKCSRKEPVSPIAVREEYTFYDSGTDYMLDNHLNGANGLYIFKHELVKNRELKYSEKLYHEDEEFITKLFFYAGKVIKTNFPVYAYYLRTDSIINNISEESTVKRLNDFLKIIQKLKEFEKGVQKTGIRTYQEKDLTALRKKNDYLALDFIIKLLRSNNTECLFQAFYPQMAEAGIFPLTQRDDDFKYHFFRSLSKYKSGRYLLKQIDRARKRKF